jgi:hypothetical protein
MKKHLFLYFILLVFTTKSAFGQNSCVGTSGQIKWSYWNFTSFPDSSDLYANENFPSRPDGFQMMGSSQSPINYNDYIGSLMRGYIQVPVTENYQFNVTGDDRVTLYLSTNDLPINKRKKAETTVYTGLTDYNKQPSQTTAVINLVGGQNYYFELFGFEATGGDHTTFYWRKPSNPDTTWRIIDFNYIKDYACSQVCPPRGTACNDGNALTTNDLQDGFCNCVGTMPTTNACVGAKGIVEAYYYDNILGDNVEPDLIAAPRFPLQPHRKERLKGAYGPLKYFANDQYGTLVQGFLTVPKTGQYEFNITGDNQTQFFLSKNDSIQYKQTHQAIVIYGIDETDHTRFTFQNIAPLTLEKGKYYYYEFRHKENSWRDHFNLYWKTSFHEQKTWKRVSNFYLHDYKCELACIPAGTLCDDGNPFTNNDIINANCECVGTPCSGANCNDLGARYTPYEVCAPTKNLVPDQSFAWESCQNAPNPNAARSTNQRWIKYNLGDTYLLKNSRIWNYNVAGETDKGFKQVVFDYSMDGNTWTALPGTFTWQAASGLADYAGFTGPNFSNVKAKFVLISAINNWGDPACSGFSKLTFEAQLCNGDGATCDDGDPLTIHDRFDNSCNCKGVKINCLSDTISLGKFALIDTLYKAKSRIITESMVNPTKNVSFTAGNSIVFLPGFEVNQAGIFKAEIKNCLSTAFVANEVKTTPPKTKETLIEADSVEAKLKRIIFKLNEPSQVKLTIKDKSENLIVTLIDDLVQTTGTQIKMLPTNKLPKGLYWVELTINTQIMREQFEVL